MDTKYRAWIEKYSKWIEGKKPQFSKDTKTHKTQKFNCLQFITS